MALTLRDVDEKLINQLKAFTGRKTATQAILDAAAQAPTLKSQLELEQIENSNLRAELKEIRLALATYIDAQARLKELIQKG